MNVFQIVNAIKEAFVAVKDFFVGLDWPEILSIVKVVFIFSTGLFFLGIISLIIRLNLVSKIKETSKVLSAPVYFSKKLMKKWIKIEGRLKLGSDAELKLAVIEADKFFDDTIKRMSFPGKDMGDRLKRINFTQIANIDDIWRAHKTRNNIVHDVNYKLTSVEAEEVVGIYKKTLEELEVL